MKKLLKYAVYLIVMVVAAIILNSCHAMYSINISCENDTIYMDGKMIDMLIPISESNSAYMEYNNSRFAAEDSEIVRYNVDGYRSILFHTNLVQDYNATQQGSKLYLNSKDNYYNLCDNFDTFCLAVFDKAGNILNISDEFPFKSSERYYLDNHITYDPVTNTVSPEYENVDGFNPWSLVSLIFAWIVPFFSIVMFLVLFLPKDVSLAKSPWTLFIFGVMLIPLVVYLFFRYDNAVKSSISDKMAVEVFFDFGVSWICVPYLLLPYIAFVAAAFVIYYRRKNDETTQNDIPMIDMK